MFAQHKKRVTVEISKKALRLLKKTGNHLPEIGTNTYSYFLTIQDSTENELSADALLYVNEGEIVILLIWEMVFDTQIGVLKARFIDGEKGAFAKELARKYMNAFLILLENTDIDKLSPLKMLTHEGNNTVLA